jgi:hypothetical protein
MAYISHPFGAAAKPTREAEQVVRKHCAARAFLALSARFRLAAEAKFLEPGRGYVRRPPAKRDSQQCQLLG